MNYTVKTIRQSLLGQGVTEVYIGDTVYPVVSTNPRALLYIVIYNGLRDEQSSFVPGDHDHLDRIVQSLQMFGDTCLVSLVEDLERGSAT